MRVWLTSCFCIATLLASSQQKNRSFFTKELYFVNDNDAYLFQYRDAYYTNGIFIRYNFAGEHKKRKMIRSFELGQMIYTPLLRRANGPQDIDRPYCGYLYLRYGETRFLPRDGVMQWSATVGTIGSASLGEQVQNGYHQLFHYSRFGGWHYQLQEPLTLDASLTYAKTLINIPSFMKLMPIGQLNLGSVFTNARVGAYLCIGAFETNKTSALWNARIGAGSQYNRRKYELFVYGYPQVLFQGYNATVQGGLFFGNEENAVLRKTASLMFQQNTGLCYANNRWTTRVEVVYQSKEATTQQKPQIYASLQLGYRVY